MNLASGQRKRPHSAAPLRNLFFESCSLLLYVKASESSCIQRFQQHSKGSGRAASHAPLLLAAMLAFIVDNNIEIALVASETVFLLVSKSFVEWQVISKHEVEDNCYSRLRPLHSSCELLCRAKVPLVRHQADSGNLSLASSLSRPATQCNCSPPPCSPARPRSATAAQLPALPPSHAA